MATEKNKAVEANELSVEERLRTLYELQVVDSEIDKIKTLRGELPLEVQDLEDEIEGLDTRVRNLENEILNLNSQIAKKKSDIENSKGLIKKYEEQQNNVRNNREFESLAKEIEFQTLEIELSEKRIREFTVQVKDKNRLIEDAKLHIQERAIDLENKRRELNEITSETQKEEDELTERSQKLEQLIEPRLIYAYKRIRSNARNGLAVATVKRDACGGCFNRIPPQRQLDIKLSKKVIVCEYCGRILVDASFAGESEE
ncbi:zinc ribbon domain-containing protein [Alistipes sp. ZOR0009]|jgi:predicted  nucleic acid-binding Zn-ribbon protein|uniref:zinc ribbon domain-containing protein n=1 Tax=Alistipes sp. ZOR0009 TaxID=1339253 RepID=UPI000645C38A|nr:C4-type zinc ribbon domain-containing protein [Alistipes sp. ZOR0009]